MDYNIGRVAPHPINLIQLNLIGGFQVIEYWAWQLINGHKSKNSDITKILDYYDFWLVPFHNPDGKENLKLIASY